LQFHQWLKNNYWFLPRKSTKLTFFAAHERQFWAAIFVCPISGNVDFHTVTVSPIWISCNGSSFANCSMIPRFFGSDANPITSNIAAVTPALIFHDVIGNIQCPCFFSLRAISSFHNCIILQRKLWVYIFI
jgi:hypothetical protein